MANDDGTVSSPTSTKALTLGAQDTKKAEDEADTTVRAYVQNKNDQGKWWKGVQGHLTIEAQNDYQGTDPRNVPGTKVTGKPRLIPGAIPEVIHIGIMTDQGEYDVMLTRSTDDPVWRVNRLDPPTEGGL